MIPSYDGKAIGADINAALAHAAREQDTAVLVCMMEETEQIVRSMSTAQERVRYLRDTLRCSLEARLGEGEVVQAPSGRYAYLGQVSAGGAKLNTDALAEMDGLPDDLHPRPTVRYPTVTDVRTALRERRITREQHDALLTEPGTRPGLRWRTLDGAGAA